MDTLYRFVLLFTSAISLLACTEISYQTHYRIQAIKQRKLNI